MPSSKKPMNPRNPRKPKSPILGFIVLLCNGSFLKDVFGIYAEDLLSTLNTKHLQEELEDTISYLKLVTCISKRKESASKPYRVDDFIHPPVPIENLAIIGVPEEAPPDRPQNQERSINHPRIMGTI